MDHTLNLLVIEDVKADFLLIERHLRQHFPAARCRCVASREELAAALDEGGWDAVLSDYAVPGMTFRDSLALIQAQRPDLPVILVSGSVGEEKAVELLKQGVWDFVLKDSLVRLAPAIRRSLEEAAERRARRAAEEALRESEEDYRSLFDNMLNGFAYCRMLFNQNEPKDFIYLKVNRAFEALTGLKNVAGKKVSEVIPGIRESDPELFEIYGRAALTGAPERFETYVEALGMWFSISVYSPRKEHFVAVFDVITERKRAETELRESETRYRRLFEEATEGIALADAKTGTLVDCNEAFLRLTGYQRSEVIGHPQRMLHPPEAGDPPVSHTFAIQRAEAQGQTLRAPLVTKAGPVRQVEIKTNLLDLGGRRLVQGFFRDVTEELRFQHERETTLTLLRLLNDPNQTRELLQRVTGLLQEWTGCEAVGVRLQAGDDFPYYETRGFPAAFVQAESQLCLQDAAGQPVRDSQGNPVIECMCGNVLCGRVNPALPFFTAKGSFWSNNTTQLLARTTEADRQARTRNRCNGEGYESVALIPLRHQTTTLGLLQLNDRAPGQFTPELLAFLEHAADQIAIALAQRQAHAALQASEARFRDVSEAAGEFIWEFDTAGRCTYLSERVEAILGYRPAELFGRSVFDLMPPAEGDRERRFLAERLQGHTGFRERTVLLQDKRGRPVWLSVTAVPTLDAEGVVRGYRGAALDITERKQAGEALAARTQQLEAVRAVSVDITRELDLATLLGLIFRRVGDLIGTGACTVWLWDEAAQVLVPQVWNSGDAWRGEVRLRLGEGVGGAVAQRREGLLLNDYRTSAYAAPVFLERTTVTAVMGEPLLYHDRLLGAITIDNADVGRPFTDQDREVLSLLVTHAAIAIENARLYATIRAHAAELEIRVRQRTRDLELANRQLEEASRRKSEFLANMSHELRTPLNSILGFAQLLLEQTAAVLSEKQTRYLTHVHNSGQHLLQLINDILDLSKVEAGKFVLQPERLPVAETLEDILVIARGLANRKGQTIRQEIARDLPWLYADPVRFKQILFNLLSNAVKFTPERGTITVRARRVPAIADFKLQIADLPTPGPSGQSAISNLQSEMLEIAVTDTGIGIKAEDLPRLFQEFVQLEGVKGQEGTGLGLALTRRLVELHGGRMWAESSGEGQGSTFTVVLPLTMGGK